MRGARSSDLDIKPYYRQASIGSEPRGSQLSADPAPRGVFLIFCVCKYIGEISISLLARIINLDYKESARDGAEPIAAMEPREPRIGFLWNYAGFRSMCTVLELV